MKRAIIHYSMALAAALSIVAIVNSPARAQSTAFTYQGRLDDAGQPANGLHDFRFRLFDTAGSGIQIGLTLCTDNVSVVDGVFTAQLDFGQQYATTAERYLEIAVRRDTGLTCANGSGFVVMIPRQQITAAPMASHANAAFSLDAADGSPASAVFVDNAGNVGVGTTTPTAKLDVRGGAMLVENLGDQADLLWLASERSWVFRQQGTGAAAALKLENVGGGGNKNFIVQTTGFMGLGTTAPAAKLDVRGDVRLGPAGEFLAVSGTENLRMLRGSIDGTGAIDAGSGFSSARLGEGLYRITFNPPFSSIPSITVSAVQPFNQSPRFATFVQSTSNASFVDIFVLFGASNPTDSDFHFCVMGPR